VSGPLECSSDATRVEIAPDSGGKVVSLFHRPSSREWLAARIEPGTTGPAAPVYGAAAAYGWDECFPTISPGRYPFEGRWAGVPLADHGELWSRPWQVLQAEPAFVELEAHGTSLPYRFTRRIDVEGETVTASYTVTNDGDDGFWALWAMHPLFAVGPGARIVLPGVWEAAVVPSPSAARIARAGHVSWPTTVAADGVVVDLATFPDQPGYALKLVTRAPRRSALADPGAGAWIGVEASAELVPNLGVWINDHGWPDGPLRLRHAALEPTSGTGDDLRGAVEAHAGWRIEPGRNLRWWARLQLGSGEPSLRAWLSAAGASAPDGADPPRVDPGGGVSSAPRPNHRVGRREAAVSAASSREGVGKHRDRRTGRSVSHADSGSSPRKAKTDEGSDGVRPVPGRLRREQMLAVIKEHEFVHVGDLSERFGVSEVTVRTDLDALARRGQVHRVRGGAIPRLTPRQEQAFEHSVGSFAAEKVAIGQAAAALITDGETVLIDVGTTAAAAARALAARGELADVVVFTNGLKTALELEPASPRISIVVLGGTLRPLQHSLVDPLATHILGQITVKTLLLGCNGVDPIGGVTNINLPEAEIKRRMLKVSTRRIVLADGSKLGQIEVAQLCSVDEVDMVITGQSADPAVVEALRERGCEVRVVG
jgi:DeoR family transcriptional regulator, aga operon transcriptional repressor